MKTFWKITIFVLGIFLVHCNINEVFAGSTFTEDWVDEWVEKICVDENVEPEAQKICESYITVCKQSAFTELEKNLDGKCISIGTTWICDDPEAAEIAKMVLLMNTKSKGPLYAKIVLACQENPPQTTCGNHIFDSGEECEDGNMADGDGCSKDCLLEKGVTGKQSANWKAVNDAASLWCADLTTAGGYNQSAACNQELQDCYMHEVKQIQNELIQKCGNRIQIGPNLSKDYLFYCDTTTAKGIVALGPKIASQFSEKIAGTCSIPKQVGSDNSGGANAGSDQPSTGEDNNDEGVSIGDKNGVGGNDVLAPQGPEKVTSPAGIAALAGGGCTLSSPVNSPAMGMSLLILAAFSVPLLRRKMA